MPATIRRSQDIRETDNEIHCITILLSNLSFSDSECSYEERQADQPGGTDHRREQSEEDGTDDSLEDWTGGDTSEYTDTDNSYAESNGSVFLELSSPPPFPFLWIILFVVMQVFPAVCFFMLIDAFLLSLVLLFIFVGLKVVAPILEQGQLQDWLTYQTHHMNLVFARYMPR